jgi:uncharacterized membrane protein
MVSAAAAQAPRDSGAGRSATTAPQQREVRYARGELTHKRYQQRRADLQGAEA